MKIWILFLCAIAAGVSAQSDELTSLDWDDDWKEYNDEWFQTRLKELDIYNEEHKDATEEDTDNNASKLEKDLDEMDLKVEQDIKKFREDDDKKVDDYQFEDNRSEQRNKLIADDKLALIHDDELNQDAGHLEQENDYDDYALNVDDELESRIPEDQNLQIPEPTFSKESNIFPLPAPESSDEIKRIMDETQAIIQREEQENNDFSEDKVVSDNRDELSKIVEETRAILDEEALKNNDFADDKMVEQIEEANSDVSDDEEINENNDELQISSQETLDVPDLENNVDGDLEEKQEDEDEDTVDKVYEDLNDDLDNLFETLGKLSKNENSDEPKLESADVDYAVNGEDSLDDKSDYEDVFDSNLSDLFAQHSKANADEEIEEEDFDEKANNDSDQAREFEEEVLDQLPYINDALPAEEKRDETTPKSVNVEDLTDDQLLQLMKEFEVQHSDDLNAEILTDDHLVNEIILEYGETKVITSENYPAGYPTNRIVDWIITGKGQGIELNVTDLAVNSALGDYLMVKPGQADESGPEGLIFAYHLNEPKAYRFTDVDRMFIRFDSKLGMSFLRGFSLTLKMIAPPIEEPEPEPEPEPLLPEPRHSLKVMLGGLTLEEFKKINEEFRQLVADMATMYINSNGIEPGVNTTGEITQIISASVCNVHWPGFEKCAEVRFSVPLVYEDLDSEEHRLNELDLQTMWDTYVDMDPFAARLTQMGIEEFSVPNDGSVLTVWMVVAMGVLISAAMLAFALWRYSCFEDYKRMPAYSDTDSLHEKRSSLYPTPHQMLPPLYAEKDYDSTRVDMGGFTNRSYTRSDMFEDSDEEAPRDRYTTDV